MAETSLDINGTKVCESCKKELSLSNFYFRKDQNRYRPACKKCKRVNTMEQIKAKANSDVKVCKHCNLEKPITEYQKAGGGKWTQPYCKICDSIRKEKHQSENLDRYIEKRRSYYKNNKAEILAKQKERKSKIPKKERVYNKMSDEERKRRKAEQSKIFRIKNAEKIREKKRQYNKRIGNQRKREWQKEKMKDVNFKITKNLRGRVYVALKRGVKSAGTMELLGCTIDFFKTYFESLFTEGMNWEKYMEGGIHIDHIIPCSKFDLTKEEEQRKCFHYTNLQPLWALDNLIKGTKILKTE